MSAASLGAWTAALTAQLKGDSSVQYLAALLVYAKAASKVDRKVDQSAVKLVIWTVVWRDKSKVEQWAIL